jgi:hypothetical protein
VPFVDLQNSVKVLLGGAGRPQKKVNLKEKNLEKFEIAAWHGRQARKVHEVFHSIMRHRLKRN